MNINNYLLQKARKEAKFTQVEVANKANISETSYQRIEYGTQQPSLVTAMLIAQALNTTVEKIFPLQQQPDGNPAETTSHQNNTMKNNELQ